MSTVDIIIVVLLLIGAFRGYQKGLLMGVVTIIAFILAIIGGFKLLHYGISILAEYTGELNGMLPYLSFIIIFISIILLVTLVGRIFKKILDLTLLGSFDNVAGAILGVVKWAFGLSILLWLTLSVGVQIPDNWLSGAVFYPYLLSFGPGIIEYASGLLPFTDNLIELIHEMLQPQIV